MGKRSKKSKDPVAIERMAATRALQQSAKEMNLEKGLDAYAELKRIGFRATDGYLFSILLHIACGATMKVSRSLAEEEGVNTGEREKTREDLGKRNNIVRQIVQDMRAAKVKITEASYSCLIAHEALVRGNLSGAKVLLREMRTNGVGPRLRTFSPLITAIGETGNCKEAFEFFADMRRTIPSVVDPTEDIFRALLRACRLGKDAEGFYATIHAMKEVITSIDDKTVAELRSWFACEIATRTTTTEGRCPEVCWRIERASVDARGCWADLKMRLVQLSGGQRDEMIERVNSLACKGERRTRQFHNFLGWLDRHGPFDVFVDTANVGLFSKERPSYVRRGPVFLPEQVESVRKHFETRGKRVLLVMHRKWMDRTSDRLKREWRKSSFVLERGNNDDWYWLAAAVRRGADALVVTNDRMRDHIYAMLAPRNFVKFKQAHVVNYRFEWAPSREAHLSDASISPRPCLAEPPTFSRRIQESARGWHFPLSTSNDWLHVVVKSSDGDSADRSVMDFVQWHTKTRTNEWLDVVRVVPSMRQVGRTIESILKRYDSRAAKKRQRVGICEPKKARPASTKESDDGDVGSGRSSGSGHDVDDEDDATVLLTRVCAEIDPLLRDLGSDARQRAQKVFNEKLRWNLSSNKAIDGASIMSARDARVVLSNWEGLLYRKSHKKRKKSELPRKKAPHGKKKMRASAPGCPGEAAAGATSPEGLSSKGAGGGPLPAT